MKRILCGVQAVKEALQARGTKLAVVWLSAAEALHEADPGVVRSSGRSSALEQQVLALASAAGVSVEWHPAAELDRLAKGLRHQGVLAIAAGDFAYASYEQLFEHEAERATPLYVLLDEITDVHNLGAIVRSAVAFDCAGIVTLKDRAAPVNGAAVRASAGATEHARIARVTNLARTLKDLHDRGIQTVGLDASAELTLDRLELRCPTALVVGAEGHGLRRLTQKRCQHLARIPMQGPIASLNASVSAGIALYEVRRQQSALA